MSKKILITGATDGIGLETAKLLAVKGHTLLLHGRNRTKLDAAAASVASVVSGATVDTFRADLSDLTTIDTLAESILSRHPQLDVIINNAGVLGKVPTMTPQGLDVHLAVNTIAPYRLTRKLQSAMKRSTSSRIINVSSAAQAPVNFAALTGPLAKLAPFEAYSQSKLAIIMWSKHLADEFGPAGPIVVAVNPGSMLGTKMVKEGFGVAGADVGIGADILCRAALDDEFAGATGKYFNNDAGSFGSPHRDARNANKNRVVVQNIEEILEQSGCK